MSWRKQAWGANFVAASVAVCGSFVVSHSAEVFGSELVGNDSFRVSYFHVSSCEKLVVLVTSVACSISVLSGASE